MNQWMIIYRFAWIALMVLVVIGLACLFLPRIHRLNAMQKTEAELAEKLRQTELATTQLRSHQERFRTDPAFVERVAHENGLVKPDEVVFKYTNLPPVAAAAGGENR